ncbi:MAG: hypothetical protein OXD43_13735 [Bacteroidetes bacterium]|nr:hypothetical protein [Bacteroidota bacterium]
MKKKYQNQKYKRYSAQRARSEKKARKQTKKRNRGVLTQPKPRRLKKRITVVAPTLFSLTKNPDETIQFFYELEAAFDKSSRDKFVFIDLKSVTEMTSEVIVVLISRIEEEKLRNDRPSYGNVPKSDVARDMLASSGFYDFVTPNIRVKKPSRGAIEKCDDNIVDAAKASQLLDKVSESLKMSIAQEDGHQTTAIECMTNTREHASGSQRSHKGTKKWWFSVYRNPNNKVAQFAFVDLGIGIFASLERHKIQLLANIKAKLGSERRSDVLKELLTVQPAGNGLSPTKRTSTRKGYRGKGLPNIARRNREKQTRRLRIISNDVFADVEKSDYRMLEQEFPGTIICWEHWTTDYEQQYD